MSGSENKANRSTSNKIFGDHIRQFLEKMMCNKGVQNNRKEMYKKVRRTCKFVFFLLIRSVDFDAVLIAVAHEDDLQRRFLGQHSVAMLVQCFNNSKQHRNNVATLCCAKNRRCESSRLTSP